MNDLKPDIAEFETGLNPRPADHGCPTALYRKQVRLTSAPAYPREKKRQSDPNKINHSITANAYVVD